MRTRASFSPIQQGFDAATIPAITRGFSIKSNRPPEVCQPPFDIPPDTHFEDFREELEISINQCLESSAISFAVHKIESVCKALALTNEVEQVYSFILNKITEFAMKIPGRVGELTSAEEIGEFWEDILNKINVSVITFSSLCRKEKELPSYQKEFYKALNESYNKNVELYEKASELIIQAYNDTRESMASETLKMQISFLESTDLFNTHFLPLLIDSVLEVIKPSIDDVIKSGIVEYLQTAQELCEREETLAAKILPQAALRKLTSSVNSTVFTQNLASFVAKNLKDLVELNDSNSISICAKLSSATNTTSAFTQDLANVFQEEVEKCFQTDDPIPKILELYGAMSKFVNAAFGTNSARVLSAGFEKGFRVDDEQTARKLEIAIHKDFPTRVDVAPYVGLFRMLRCKDVFQSYHTLYLNRRALELSSEQLESDRKFAEELKESCGSKYTEPMYQTLSDYDLSMNLRDAFFTKYSRQFASMKNIFQPLIFARESWPSIELKHAKVPHQIQEIMTCYEQFTEEETKGKKIMWSMQLTSVLLRAEGFEGVDEVKCNGTLALILLALSDGAKTKEDIMNRTLLEEKDIESGLSKLSMKKSGKLVNKSPPSLNQSASYEGGCVSIFSFNPAPMESMSTDTPAVYDKQIDAACMKILKDNQSLDKEDLFNSVVSFLPPSFKVTKQLFEESLTKLELRGFIKVDPSGRVHYLP